MNVSKASVELSVAALLSCLVAVLMSSSAVAQDLTPVSWWSADNGFNDVLGNNPGTVNGTVTFVPGQIGQAFHFTGSGYITWGNNSAGLSPTSQVMIVAWIRPDFTASNEKDTIITKRDGCGNRSYELSVYNANAGLPVGTIVFATSLGTDLYGNAVVPNDGQFHQVAGSYDGQTMRVFLDGQLVAQKSLPGSIESTAALPITGVDAGCGDPTQADIDEIRVFSDGGFISNGANTFNGNQTVNGNVTATSFRGDGSGLTGVNVATATTASGLTCAGCVGNPQLAINYAGSASQGGPASNTLLFGGLAPSAFATIGSNTFTGQQTMPNLTVSGQGTFGTLSAFGGIIGFISGSGAPAGVVGVTGNGNPAVEGQVEASSGPAGYFNVCNACPGNNGGTGNLFAGGDIIDGANGAAIQFRVDYAGNLTTAGSVTIGGGTPILEYVSVTDSLTIPALTPVSCTTFTTAALTGFTPGASDTIALGTPSSLVSGLGNGIFLQYQAWETTTTASPTITIQVCNPSAVKYKGGATGTIRVDIFKH